jgi:glycosyltransferase involved in cell wall biosynthesis
LTSLISIVTFTTLFPNAAQPGHGVFVENRLRHLVADGRVVSRVVAPVPWLPAMLAQRNLAHAHLPTVPLAEVRSGIRVVHPRYPVIPKIGMTIAPTLLFARALPALRRLQRASGDFHLIDAHYFYPDGVAAAMLGKVLRKPVVITARGSDVNLIARYALPRRMIRGAARAAGGVITVSQALKDALVAIGLPDARIRVLRNGVDLAMFCPQDRTASRAALGIEGPTLVSVGALIELKGHDLVIRALLDLPGYSLTIAGEGPQRASLEQLAANLGIADRVLFLGRVGHDELARIYSAADALVLASSREGWPNVLLEAMACGTPAIVSAVGGAPEVVARPEAGLVLSERSASCVAATVRQLFAALPDRAATRRYAEGFSWDATTEGQVQLFREILKW